MILFKVSKTCLRNVFRVSGEITRPHHHQYLPSIDHSHPSIIIDLSSSISTLVKPDILSALCKQEIDEYFAKEAQVYEAQVDSINKLEKYLEQSEMDRVSQIGSSLLEFGRAVYKIKFESPSSVTRMVQDEAVSINLASIKNREDIVQFCSAFMAMNEENHEASVGTLKVIYKKWQDSRFNALYELFIDDIKRAANKDVRNHYKKYQAIFDEYLKRQVELLNSVVSVPFSKISLEWIKEWEHKCKDILGAHQESITLFKRDVQSFDDDLEKHGRAVFDQYLPSLEECDLYEKKKLTEKMNGGLISSKKKEG